MKRIGSCRSDCGLTCCSKIVLQVSPEYLTNPDVKKWIEYHGITLTPLTRDGMTGAFASIPLACQKLTPEGKCSVYGTPERPDLCDKWPHSPADLDDLPTCGYSFVPDTEGSPM